MVQKIWPAPNPRETSESGTLCAHQILMPREQTIPLVFSSPHSGSHYPVDFVARSRLDPTTLRRSEDSFVDEVFSAVPDCGAPLLKALFPRAYVDVNREAFELDPTMFEDPLPSFVNTHSPRIAAGLGTIARVVGNGIDIYRSKLSFAEVEQRIRLCYHPYHAALKSLITQTVERFGYCIVIDCHSMPSFASAPGNPGISNRIDFVLGNHYGESCSAAVTGCAASVLRGFGYRVNLNKPYAGGFITTHYGCPANAVHALQIEISRDIYMDEASLRRGSHLPRLAAQTRTLIERLGQLEASDLNPAIAAE